MLETRLCISEEVEEDCCWSSILLQINVQTSNTAHVYVFTTYATAFENLRSIIRGRSCCKVSKQGAAEPKLRTTLEI